MEPISITPYPSPNFGPRPDGTVIDTLVLHYTDTRCVEDALAILTDKEKQVSAHYVIGAEGEIYALVPEEMRAWHAGLGSWRGADDVNSRSIGIELQNPGTRFGLAPFPETQMHALLSLCQEICRRWPIETRNIIGHSDLAPDRKVDPGPLFDWHWLAQNGIGFWPADMPAEACALTSHEMLVDIGYPDGAEKNVAAFQLRFRPSKVDNRLDAETKDLIVQVYSMIHAL